MSTARSARLGNQMSSCDPFIFRSRLSLSTNHDGCSEQNSRRFVMSSSKNEPTGSKYSPFASPIALWRSGNESSAVAVSLRKSLRLCASSIMAIVCEEVQPVVEESNDLAASSRR